LIDSVGVGILRPCSNNHTKGEIKMITYFQANNIQNIDNSGIALEFNALQNILIGPNASGKSNILKAITFLKQLITNKGSISVHPYRFSESDKCSSLVVIFKIDDIYYRYSVQYFINDKRFEKEIFEKSSNNKDFITIVTRDKNEIIYPKPIGEIAIDAKTSIIALLTLLQIDDDVHKFFHFVDQYIYFVSSGDSNIKEQLISLHNDKKSDRYFSLMSQRLEELRLGIQSIDVSPAHYGKRDVVLYHHDIDQHLSIDLESKGTKRLIEIIYVLCIVRPHIVIIDEVENTVHPSVIKKLMLYAIENKQQLIFSTHTRELVDIHIDSHYPSKKIFFVSKDAHGSVSIIDTDSDDIELDIHDNIYSIPPQKSRQFKNKSNFLQNSQPHATISTKFL